MTPLSPAQQQVVAHRGSDLQVIACAGSGKTESMARRVAALVAEGADPASIVAFTFTERAAAELRERIVRRITEAAGPVARDRIGPLYVGTIHAYCLRVLQDHVPRFGNHDIVDENRHSALLSREFRHLGIDRLGPKHWQPVRDFARTVDVLGNELIPDAALAGTPLLNCVQGWRTMLERHRLLTYASLVAEAVRALEDPSIHGRVHGPLRHLLVDEYQDVNPAQERLIELLAQPPVTLVVVGDDDQCLYQWRGADVSSLRGFLARRPTARAVHLDTNRRSRPAIVEAAAQFATSIDDRLPKVMLAAREATDLPVTIWSAETDADEAAQLADAVVQLHARGFRWREVAVLFRSVRTSAAPLIDALGERGVPFQCRGRTGLFLQPDVALFAELFAWFVGGAWKDGRWEAPRPADMNAVVAGLSQRFRDVDELPGLRQYVLDWQAFQLRGTRPVSLVDDFYRLLARLGAPSLSLDDPEVAARAGAWARFSEVLGDFEHVQRRGRLSDADAEPGFRAGRDRGKPYFQALHNYLLHWARDAYEDFPGEPAADLDAVDVLTVHQSKGLEWPVVFLPSLVEGRFPSGLAGRPQDWLLPDAAFPATLRARYEGGEPEERRTFYVAMTRAREALYLSSFARKARSFKPSVFLREVEGLPGVRRVRGGPLPLPDPPSRPAVVEQLPLEVSFSDLATFDECGHSWRLGTSFGFQQPVALELNYGRALHHLLRRLADEARALGRLPSPEWVNALLDTDFYIPFATEPAWKQMRATAARLLRSYVRDFGDDLLRVAVSERPFTMRLDEGTVAGRADVLLDGGTEGLDLVDYKVAAEGTREARYRLQLQVYAAAARAEGVLIRSAWLHELKDGRREPVDVGVNAILQARGRVTEQLRALRTGRFEARPTPSRCDACSWKRLCGSAVSAS